MPNPSTAFPAGIDSFAGGDWDPAIALAVNALELFAKPTVNSMETAFVSPRGSDSNDGLTLQTAKATVAAAYAVVPGGMVQLPYGGVPLGANFVPEAGTYIRGLGRGMSVVNVSADGARGTYAIDGSQTGNILPLVLRHFSLRGPGNGAFVIGTAPAQMSGVRTGQASVIEDVEISSFYAGVEFASNHEIMRDVKIHGNYYNVYKTGFGSSKGNQTFINCDLTGATRASMAVAGTAFASFDFCEFIAVHCGFAPGGVYKEATQAGGDAAAISSSRCNIYFEQCGNACILDATVSGTNYTLEQVTFHEPTWDIEGVGGTYYDSSLPSNACVNVVGVAGAICILENGAPPSGGTIWHATALSSTVSTDKLPAEFDFDSNFVGSTYRSDLTGGAGVVMAVLATVVAGQVLQLQSYYGVKPFGSDTAKSYIGVAATNAASGETVCVLQHGFAYVLCSDSVPFHGILMEIDPAAPTQVRSVNQDEGTAVSPTTRAPSIYPIIGVQNTPNSGVNTLTVCWLQDPAPNRQLTLAGQVSALPTPSATYKGQLLMIPGNGTTIADVVSICLESTTGSYSWKTVASG